MTPPAQLPTENPASPSLDLKRLEEWLDDAQLPGIGEPLSAEFITGGASNDLFEVTRGDFRVALRKPPAHVPDGRNATMLREYRLLKALRDTDVPHARAVAVCEDPDVIGGCFYLMEFVDGWSPIQEGMTWPSPFGTSGNRRALAFELVDGIARLSRVDWQARGLQGFGHPDGFHERQVARWLAHLEAVRFREIPGLAEAADWLSSHKPRLYEPGIMHGDYQFANVMFRHDTPPQLAAIVDWEMATVGDPLLDLGWVVNGWPDGKARPDGEATPEGGTSAKGAGSIGYVDYTGMPSVDAILGAYEDRSGRSVEDIDYYVVLARFKLAVVLEAGYARFVQGESDNQRMEFFGPVVLEMARKAADLAASTSLRQ